MEKEITLSPELIATGKVTRDQLTNLIYQAAKACNLDPIEKLRFYRELEKAAGNAVKMDDPEYAEENVAKINAYEKNGYYPGKNLILTFETKGNPFDVRKIEDIAKQYLL